MGICCPGFEMYHVFSKYTLYISIGTKITTPNYKVLVASNDDLDCLNWEHSSFGNIPENALQAEHEDVDYIIYIARS